MTLYNSDDWEKYHNETGKRPIKFHCSICDKDCGIPSEKETCSTGYGIDPKTNLLVCFACCAEQDKEQMKKEGKITLYLTDYKKDFGHITNWPNSLQIKHGPVRVGNHNIARHRYDVWFTFEGQNWHGVQYGNNTQICHCKRVK